MIVGLLCLDPRRTSTQWSTVFGKIVPNNTFTVCAGCLMGFYYRDNIFTILGIAVEVT